MGLETIIPLITAVCLSVRRLKLAGVSRNPAEENKAASKVLGNQTLL